jgi:Meckelin (Transmembrane protein 67)
MFALSVTNLVDLCSVANISIFIFDHHLYGYYIHGSCCHGYSDVDLLTWYINLSCEQVCPHLVLFYVCVVDAREWVT